jgi:hypothetical protein
VTREEAAQAKQQQQRYLARIALALAD